MELGILVIQKFECALYGTKFIVVRIIVFPDLFGKFLKLNNRSVINPHQIIDRPTAEN
ncbi:hypothetical protein D3C85_1317980 [compost metagenome]